MRWHLHRVGLPSQRFEPRICKRGGCCNAIHGQCQT
jgi:hypothetical protein